MDKLISIYLKCYFKDIKYSIFSMIFFICLSFQYCPSSRRGNLGSTELIIIS